MRILIAGATGAIGRLSIRRLQANQHEVFALTRSPDSAPALREIGAEAAIADALDAAAVKTAVGRIRPDAVINELTSLPRHYTPAEMKAAAERDRKVRVEAGVSTYRELEAHASAMPGIEFVALRYGFFYGPGTWYTREGDMGDQVRRQQVPIIGEGQGVYSFLHIDDAAGATAAALE